MYRVQGWEGRVTQTAMIHELTQQQTRSIEKVVPWFLNTMPAPYFRQVPESFRLDHIKAIVSVASPRFIASLPLQTRSRHVPVLSAERHQGREHVRWLLCNLFAGVSMSSMYSPCHFFNRDMHMNLKTHLPDGRQVSCFFANDELLCSIHQF